MFEGSGHVPEGKFDQWLEEARYIACAKGYEGRVPKTEFKLTASGRKALERYLAHMEALIKSVRER